jgi:hypothetical protein
MNIFDYRKVLTPRRLRLAYTSPPICEGDFTATGLQVISLLPLFIAAGPTGLVMEPWFGRYRLQWNTVPGALCYSIYRLADPLNPFSPFILVAECIGGITLEVDPGIYCVTAITPEGETECSEQAGTPPAPPLPPYVPEDPPPENPVPDPTPPPDIPGTCGDGTPVVPETLLEELDEPEFITSATANGATAGQSDFTTPSGRIATQYVSGYVWDDCVVSPGSPIRDAFITNTWLIHDGDVDSPFGAQFGCFGATGTPPNCTPSVSTQWETEYPDDNICDHALIGQASAGPRTYAPTDDIIGDTQTFYVPGSIQAGTCHNGGSLVMNLLRTHAFIPQASALTIQSYNSIKYTLGCVTAADGDTAPQWNGIINDSYVVGSTIYQCFEGNNGEYIGATSLVAVDVRLVAGEKWTISVIGNHPTSGFVVLFSGEKRYGQTAHGNYGRTGGCSTLGCITLT